ncbi:hypothetical protein NLJ89_g3215 [Agrocybe chaxingu]|uniref:Uncharacterized protein n=1 Tax=Agrocybe chaxingu TaxID=84603 RepID=A0A9W8MXI5_9AGAR|nr:hypothetical protein NLJ89_g3215 [Agrocybe chaxingu]
MLDLMSPTLPNDVLFAVVQELSLQSSQSPLLACCQTSRVLNHMPIRYAFSMLLLCWKERGLEENEQWYEDIHEILLSNEHLRSCVCILDIAVNFMGEYTLEEVSLPSILNMLRAENCINSGIHTIKLTGYGHNHKATIDWNVMSEEFHGTLYGLISDSRISTSETFVKLRTIHLYWFQNITAYLVIHMPDSVESLSLLSRVSTMEKVAETSTNLRRRRRGRRRRRRRLKIVPLASLESFGISWEDLKKNIF